MPPALLGGHLLVALTAPSPARTVVRVEQRKRHWWNGKWGRLARRDVLLYQDDKTSRWSVEARDGGVEGERRVWELACEPDAMKLIEDLMSDPIPGEAWRELPVT